MEDRLPSTLVAAPLWSLVAVDLFWETPLHLVLV
jgi:hypothetical protein